METGSTTTASATTHSPITETFLRPRERTRISAALVITVCTENFIRIELPKESSNGRRLRTYAFIGQSEYQGSRHGAGPAVA